MIQFKFMLSAAIFDLDGVIVDTERIHYHTFKTTLSELGISIPEDRWYREFTGIGSKNILRILFEENGINESIEKWFEKRRRAFFDYIKEHGVKTIAGVETFLVELKNNNIKTAVATGSGRELTLFILDKLALTQFFDAIVTADDVTYKKPHPEIFLKAASMLGAKTYECVVFEDSKNGVAAAKAAEMKIIGLKSPSLPENECTLVIKDFRGFSLSKLRSLF
jgi:beta-phosphoglucomutase family hydrolase